jgi:predicted HAD superfamily Cof-like phosphohydrolase
LDELTEALKAKDPVGALDALTDLQYVLDGTYLSLGLASLKGKAFDEVHRSNMSKLGADGKPIYREDGKVLKGPDYSPPDLGQFINKS